MAWSGNTFGYVSGVLSTKSTNRLDLDRPIETNGINAAICPPLGQFKIMLDSQRDLGLHGCETLHAGLPVKNPWHENVGWRDDLVGGEVLGHQVVIPFAGLRNAAYAKPHAGHRSHATPIVHRTLPDGVAFAAIATTVAAALLIGVTCIIVAMFRRGRRSPAAIGDSSGACKPIPAQQVHEPAPPISVPPAPLSAPVWSSAEEGDFIGARNLIPVQRGGQLVPQIAPQPQSISQRNSLHMDGRQFEEYIAWLLRKLGYSEVSTTRGSGDHGADVLATKDDVRIAIQAKKWESSVGNKAVQEVFAATRHYGADVGWVITNSTFTPHARELAHSCGVRLIDGHELNGMIARAGAGPQFVAPRFPASHVGRSLPAGSSATARHNSTRSRLATASRLAGLAAGLVMLPLTVVGAAANVAASLASGPSRRSRSPKFKPFGTRPYRRTSRWYLAQAGKRKR
jgi:hypothetical protein